MRWVGSQVACLFHGSRRHRGASCRGLAGCGRIESDRGCGARDADEAGGCGLADDGHLGCAQLTPTLKRKFIAIAAAASEQPTCAGFARLFAPFGKTETLAQAVGVAANAQITVQGKSATVQNSAIRFRHLNGKWLANRLSLIAG